MARTLVGYARCSTDAHDLTAQQDVLAALGVKPNQIDVDQDLTGTNRARPGLREALAVCRSGDTLVVTKKPKLKPAQEKHLVELRPGGKHTGAELAELFSVARSTVYRAVQRAGELKPARRA